MSYTLEAVIGGEPLKANAAGLLEVLARWSEQGPVAYVEADYFGGVGTQRAAVWSGGGLSWGPLGAATKHDQPAEGTPISQALRRLGIRRGEFEDEFTAAGLHRHRHTTDWAEAAQGRESG